MATDVNLFSLKKVGMEGEGGREGGREGGYVYVY